MPRGQKGSRPPHTAIDLTTDELQCLVAVSDYYQRSWGPMRHLVRLTTAPEMRTRLRFLSDESRVLRSFAQAKLAEAGEEPDVPTRVEFTPAALIAFWGRILSSLQSTRSRRRLKASEIALRETLAGKLEAAARSLRARHGDLVDAAIDARRPVEQAWMHERLEPASPVQ
jgi:hypothetical protein